MHQSILGNSREKDPIKVEVVNINENSKLKDDPLKLQIQKSSFKRNRHSQRNNTI
tara:strand:- start:1206 stop:1370 length:165 start_codon:yes stop_codon:yes gene_type:complete